MKFTKSGYCVEVQFGLFLQYEVSEMYNLTDGIKNRGCRGPDFFI